MLIKSNTLRGYKLLAMDGEIGKARDFYFDDEFWTIRYLVASTGNWLAGKQVLLAPYALGKVSTENENVEIHLTREQIEGAPSPDSDKPVSRQDEMEFAGYYGWPHYWTDKFLWGAASYAHPDQETFPPDVASDKSWDPHLWSTEAVEANAIHALDGELGHVDDFIIDDATWTIRYLVIDTKNWLPGRKVLVSPRWIDRIDWDGLKVFVNLTRDAIKNSPEYSEDALLDREYEMHLHGHYNRDGYWEENRVYR